MSSPEDAWGLEKWAPAGINNMNSGIGFSDPPAAGTEQRAHSVLHLRPGQADGKGVFVPPLCLLNSGPSPSGCLRCPRIATCPQATEQPRIARVQCPPPTLTHSYVPLHLVRATRAPGRGSAPLGWGDLMFKAVTTTPTHSGLPENRATPCANLGCVCSLLALPCVGPSAVQEGALLNGARAAGGGNSASLGHFQY